MRKKQLQLNTFASFCLSVTAGQAEQQLLCQWVSRERQQPQKSLSETSVPCPVKYMVTFQLSGGILLTLIWIFYCLSSCKSGRMGNAVVSFKTTE